MNSNTRSVILCLAGLAMLALIPGIQKTDAAPIQWSVASGGNGHFYEAVYVGPFTTWFAANAIAEARGGHLVTITSAAENEFVYELIKNRSDLWTFNNPSNSAHGPWIGGIQNPAGTEPDQGWEWVTGEPWVYQNWHSHAPNESSGVAGLGDEDYLHFYNAPSTLEGPFWNDNPAYGFDIRGYVIEFVFVPEPATATLLLVGLASFGRRVRRKPCVLES